MRALMPESAEAKAIDDALSAWRQGDLALDESWFIHVGDPAEPLSEAAAEANDAGLQALTSEVLGLVVVTQTCDIVRACTMRPYVEVAPLVSVSAEDLLAVQRCRRPYLAALPSLAERRLVVDLDRVMTVEKAIVAKWLRSPGCESDSDARAFAQALARKRARFAFPDEFTELAKKLQGRLAEKHEKHTDEGRGLRALREIRVQAAPAWDAKQISLLFWFVRHDGETDFEGKRFADLLEQWLRLIPTTDRFVEVEGLVVTLDDMTAADYVGSDPLDLDHLSTRAAQT